MPLNTLRIDVYVVRHASLECVKLSVTFFFHQQTLGDFALDGFQSNCFGCFG